MFLSLNRNVQNNNADRSAKEELKQVTIKYFQAYIRNESGGVEAQDCNSFLEENETGRETMDQYCAILNLMMQMRIKGLADDYTFL